MPITRQTSKSRRIDVELGALSPPDTESECPIPKKPSIMPATSASTSNHLPPSPHSGRPFIDSGGEEELYIRSNRTPSGNRCKAQKLAPVTRARRKIQDGTLTRKNKRLTTNRLKSTCLCSNSRNAAKSTINASLVSLAEITCSDELTERDDLPHTPASIRVASAPLDLAFAPMTTGAPAARPPLPHTPHARKIGVADRFVPDRTREDSARRYRLSLVQDDPSSPLSNRQSAGNLEDESDVQLYRRALKNELYGSTDNDYRSARRTLFFNTLYSSTPPRSTSTNDEAQERSLHDHVDNGAQSLDTSSPLVLPSPAWTSADPPKLSTRLNLACTFASSTRARIADSTALIDNPFFDTCPLNAVTRRMLAAPRLERRAIPKLPFKVLDAPDLADDFYLNLLDWGNENILAVGLGSSVYLWNSDSAVVSKLCDMGPYDMVTALKWNPRGNHLGIGTSRGEVQLWDVSRQIKVHGHSMHTGRVASLAWRRDLLTSGSRDRSILQWDASRSEFDQTTRLVAHRQEVCGLQWSPDESKLASGGNDNRLFIWDVAQLTSPLLRYAEHTAAIKAISWSPHHSGLLVSGGGTADQHLRFWNTKTSSTTSIQSINTNSQVCNVAWSRTSDELVSTHGYSQHQIVVWRYPTMTPLATLTGHLQRVLYLSVAPDGQRICTGAADETLRFWSVFPSPKKGESKLPQYSQWMHYR